VGGSAHRRPAEAGDVRAANASLGDVSIDIVESGSIVLLDVEASSRQLDLSFRNAENRLCLGSDLPPSSVSIERSTNAHANCDVSGVVDGSSMANCARRARARRTVERTPPNATQRRAFTFDARRSL
jgi:hypothetical protein